VHLFLLDRGISHLFCNEKQGLAMRFGSAHLFWLSHPARWAEMTPLAGKCQQTLAPLIFRIHGRNLSISHGQTRCANYRNQDGGVSPARYRAA